jgi:hypothetical protein
MSIEGRRSRSRWRRALTVAELVAVAGFVALVFALYEGQSSLTAGQIGTLRVVFGWCLALGWPLLPAYILRKAREDWPALLPEASRWAWWLVVPVMVLLFAPVEYMAIAFLIPGLLANTNLLIGVVALGLAGPVVLIWLGFHVALLRARPDDDGFTRHQPQTPRSR